MSVWLKRAHGIDRIGPFATLILVVGPVLLGMWLNAAIHWKHYGPKRRRWVAVVVPSATLVILSFLALVSYALAFGVGPG